MFRKKLFCFIFAVSFFLLNAEDGVLPKNIETINETVQEEVVPPAEEQPAPQTENDEGDDASVDNENTESKNETENTDETPTETKKVTTENQTDGMQESDANTQNASDSNISTSSITVPKAQPKTIQFNYGHVFAGGVTEIVVNSRSSEFFVSGNDGFVTKFNYPSMKPDTWQLSSLAIKKMVLHPNDQHLAIYETNGLSDHRISVWDWHQKKCLFTKKMSNTVVSLSWSAKGTYLFVGNNSMQGITVFNVAGQELSIFDVPPGIVLLAATGPTEKSVITYGETGRLVYTSLIKKQFPTQYSTESRLKSPNLIQNFTQVIGYKNNNIYVIDALSGKTIQKYSADAPIFASRIKDKVPMWIDLGTKPNTWCIRQGNVRTPNFSLPKGKNITTARHVGQYIIVGTDAGFVFKLKQEKDKSISHSQIDVPVLKNIQDIETNGKSIFLLTDNELYYTATYEEPAKLLTTNVKADSITACGEDLIFWSKKNKQTVYYYSLQTNNKKAIYNPKEPLTSLTVYKDKIVISEPFSGVSIIDINTGKRLFHYVATGIQDAIQVNDRYMVITKSAIDQTKTPLFLINVKTAETLPFPMNGNFAFSLTRNTVNENQLNCFVLSNNDGITQTELFSIDVNTSTPVASKFKRIASYKKEDLNAFVSSNGPIILTNLGSYSLIYHNTRTKKTLSMPRVYSLTKKAVSTNDFIVSLNSDSSLLWYEWYSLNVAGITNIPYDY